MTERIPTKRLRTPDPETKILGARGADSTTIVSVHPGPIEGGAPYPLPKITKICPTWDWGEGAGLTHRQELSIAILCNLFRDGIELTDEYRGWTHSLHNGFANDVVVELDRLSWSLTFAQIMDWLARQGIFFNGLTWRIIPGYWFDLVVRGGGPSHSWAHPYLIEPIVPGPQPVDRRGADG